MSQTATGARVAVPLSPAEELARLKNRGAMIVSFFALLLALFSITSNGNSGAMLNATLSLNDTWAFFQAKSVKQSIAQASLDAVTREFRRADLSPAERTALLAQQTEYHNTIDRYESDPKSNEGKKQLVQRAESLEAQRDLMKRKGFYFSLGTGLIQVGMVLCSAGMLSGRKELLQMALLAGSIGSLLFANGFLGIAI